MVKEITDEKIVCVCKCGLEFSISAETLNSMKSKSHEMWRTTLLGLYERTVCDACAEKERKEKEEKARLERLAMLQDSLRERETEAGFPSGFCCLEKPFMREAAVFFYKHREESVIVSGATGTGKTSSALYVLGLMLKENELRVKYYTRHGFFAEYVKAKTSKEDSEEAFLSRLNHLDYIVLDELVGKKGDSALSDSAQELLFNLVDGVYCGARRSKVWILGNFYQGALSRLVADVAPLKRRLKTSFRPAYFDMLPDESDVRVDESVVIE